MTNESPATVVDRLLAGIESGCLPPGLFADDAVLDATVPNWRFTTRGGDHVRDVLSRWFADPGRFKELRRTALPAGELVEFALAWHEEGVAHLCHQAHILTVRGGRISADTAFCGGRWAAPLIAEMDRAAREGATA